MLLLFGNLYSAACQSTYIASPWDFVYWQYASCSKRAVIKWVFQGTHTCHSLKNWALIHIHVCVSCLVVFDSAIAYTKAHQALPSMGSSRQEHWSGLPLPSPKGTTERKKVMSLSHVWLFATPWTVAYQTPPSMEFSGKSTGVGCHSFSVHIRGYLLISCWTEQSGNLPDFKLKWHNFYFSIGGMSKNLWSFSIIINTVQ